MKGLKTGPIVNGNGPRYNIYTQRAPSSDNFTPLTSVENIALHVISYYGHVMVQNPFEKYNKSILKYKSMKDLGTTKEALFDILLAKYGLTYASAYYQAVYAFRHDVDKSLTMKKLEVKGETKKELGREMRKIICKTFENLNVVHELVLENHSKSIIDILMHNNKEIYNNLLICSLMKDNIIVKMLEKSDLKIEEKNEGVTLPSYAEEEEIENPVIEDSIPEEPDYNEIHDQITSEGKPDTSLPVNEEEASNPVILPEIIDEESEAVTLPEIAEEEEEEHEAVTLPEITEEEPKEEEHEPITLPEIAEEDSNVEQLSDEDIQFLLNAIKKGTESEVSNDQKIHTAVNMRLSDAERKNLSMTDSIQIATAIDTHKNECNRMLYNINNIIDEKPKDTDEVLFESIESLYYTEILEKILSTGISREKLYDNYNVLTTALYEDSKILFTYPNLRPNASNLHNRDIYMQNIVSLYRELVDFIDGHYKNCCVFSTTEAIWYSTYNKLFSLLTLLIANVHLLENL